MFTLSPSGELDQGAIRGPEGGAAKRAERRVCFQIPRWALTDFDTRFRSLLLTWHQVFLPFARGYQLAVGVAD